MNKLAKYLLAGLLTVIALFIAWYFSNIIVYILIAAVLSLMGKPVMSKLTELKVGKIHLPRGVAALTTLLLMLGIFVLLFLLIVPTISTFFNNLLTFSPEEISHWVSEPFAKVNEMIRIIFPSIDTNFKVEAIIFEGIKKSLTTSTITTFFTSVASFLINIVIGGLIVLFITFFFLKEQNMFENMVLALFPERHEERAKRALRSSNHLLVRYFIGVTIQIVAITFISTLGLHFIAGLDFSYSLALGFISGILNTIPYIGPWLGALIGILITLTTQVPPPSGYAPLIFKMVLVYGGSQLIDNFVFQPFIFSSSVKAHPLEIFLVVLIAASIGGVLGMLIAIPVYTVLRVFAAQFFSNFKLVKKLTDNIQEEQQLKLE